MPSSTSNSKSDYSFAADRVPVKSHAWIWCASLALFALGWLGLESALRSHGFRPSVVDSQDLWAFHRHQISSDNDHLVLVGASRLRLGFSSEVFASTHPDWKFTNLAIDGVNPIATLRDLANDPRVRGTVICSLHAEGISSATWEQQTPYVHHAHQTSLIAPWVHWCKAVSLQSVSAVVGQQLNWKSLAMRGLTGKSLKAPPVVTLPDRTGRGYYARDFEPESADEPLEPPVEHLDWSRWQQDAKAVIALAEQIEQRGGRVIFVRYPESGSRWERFEAKYPKAKYWDFFASHATCLCLHFQDEPSLSKFHLPDNSHLNYEDTVVFTKALLELIEETKN